MLQLKDQNSLPFQFPLSIEMLYCGKIKKENMEKEKVSDSYGEKIIEGIMNLRQAIHELFKEYVEKVVARKSDGTIMELKPYEVSLREKIDILTRYGLIPWVVRKGEKLYILDSIRDYFPHCPFQNLRELAEALGVEDRYIANAGSIAGKISGRTPAIVLSLDELVEILSPEILD